MTVAEVLECVEQTLADPAHWTKGALARDGRSNAFGRGMAVDPHDPDAVSFCLVGAVRHCCEPGEAGFESYRATVGTLRAVLDRTRDQPLSGFNDYAEHADVLKLVRKARETV